MRTHAKGVSEARPEKVDYPPYGVGELGERERLGER
jgi:hypothetical protein